jgi:cobalt-zinc-cadmium efflux system membrane fusion protein
MRTWMSSLVLLLCLSGCTRQQEDKAMASPVLLPAAASVENGCIRIPLNSPMLEQLRVAPVETAELPTTEVVAPGKIEVNPNRVAHIVLPVAGRVTSVLVKLGDAVREGQPLLTVQSPDADAAMATYLQAQASVTQAKAALGKAQADLDRLRDLYAHNAAAKKDVLDAENTHTQAKAALAQTVAALAQAAQRLALLGLKPGDLKQQVTVRAPLAGKVLDLSVVPGEFRNDTSASLMTIADLSTVWVAADVPESYIRFVQVGEPVEINLVAYPGETFDGRVMRIADTVDPQTRTIKVRAEMQNPQERFRPEMFGSIHHIEAKKAVPVLSAGAVVQSGEHPRVFIEQAPGQFRQTDVTVGKRTGDLVPILSGVQAGERVVVDGVMLLSGLSSQLSIPAPGARVVGEFPDHAS